MRGSRPPLWPKAPECRLSSMTTEAKSSCNGPTDLPSGRKCTTRTPGIARRATSSTPIRVSVHASPLVQNKVALKIGRSSLWQSTPLEHAGSMAHHNAHVACALRMRDVPCNPKLPCAAGGTGAGFCAAPAQVQHCRPTALAHASADCMYLTSLS